jgi:hypothetical protein
MEDIRKGVCPLCRHSVILEFATGQAVASETQTVPWTTIVREQPVKRTGELQMFICRSCGYAQSFARAPADIPVGADHHTRIINGPEPVGPYR